MVATQNPIEDWIESLLADLNFLLTDPINFFDTYFWSAPGYNFYNTVVYVLVGLIGVFIIGTKILPAINNRAKARWGENFIPVKMDIEFFVAILPYIFVGSTFRALQDIAVAGRIISPYEIFGDRAFVTPGVYIITILLTIGVGIFSIYTSQEYLSTRKPFSNWRYTFFSIGLVMEIILIIPVFVLLLEDTTYLVGGAAIILLSLIFGVIFNISATRASNRFIPDAPMRREEVLAMTTQMYDAINTVIAIEFFSYEEKHYLPSLLFEGPFGSWPFLFIKFGIVLFFFWALRGLQNQEQERWLLWVVFLLGLATGTRDLLRLVTNT